MIGAVYWQCAEAEPFYAGSHALPQIGILSASYSGLDAAKTGKSEEGVVQMCEESHYDCAVCDSVTNLAPFEMVILPDTTVIIPELKRKLADYYNMGGKLVLSYRSGFDEHGNWALDFLPLQFFGEVEKFPTYWRAREDFEPGLYRSDRVFYQRDSMSEVEKKRAFLSTASCPTSSAPTLHFSSHFQTPPLASPGEFPAVLAGERFVYFADPVFREYRQAGNISARDVWRRVTRQLIGEPPFGRDLPGTVLIYPRRRQNDLLLTLLHYIPVRKSLDIDIIEERSSFGGELIYLANPASKARIYRGNELRRNDALSFFLPTQKGRLLVEVTDYFLHQPGPDAGTTPKRRREFDLGCNRS